VGVQLARVFDRSELEGPRGADIRVRIEVPAGWLIGGFRVEVLLPRLAVCASCDAGGCDLCERGGAVATRGRGEPGEVIEVELPARSEGATLRLRGRGGPGREEGIERGLLLLEVRPGGAVSDGVTLVTAPEPAEPAGAASPAEPQASIEVARPWDWVPWALWVLSLAGLVWWVSRGR
jgi:hypothetical protein